MRRGPWGPWRDLPDGDQEARRDPGVTCPTGPKEGSCVNLSHQLRAGGNRRAGEEKPTGAPAWEGRLGEARRDPGVTCPMGTKEARRDPGVICLMGTKKPAGTRCDLPDGNQRRELCKAQASAESRLTWVHFIIPASVTREHGCRALTGLGDIRTEQGCSGGTF